MAKSRRRLVDLRRVIRELFRDEVSERALAELGHHVALPTFNLSTTSLRHLTKWYDRLDEIAAGESSTHPNFFSDPVSLGLVKSNHKGLTLAGERFRASRGELYEKPAASEYQLVKTLYYSGLTHSSGTEDFLSTKRQNLSRFLTNCRVTSGSSLLLAKPKLLSIAEALAGFPGALERFVLIDPGNLERIEALGEDGMKELWSEAEPPSGLGRLLRKIAGDYTRASDRRLHYLMSVLLNEMRSDLSRRGLASGELRIPFPFSNLVVQSDLIGMYSAYTNDLAVAEDGGRLLVLIEPSGAPAPTSISQIGIRTPGRARGRSAPPKITVREPSSARRVVDAVLAKEAEDYVERTILAPRYGARLVRVGHTGRELVLLGDGAFPGADFYSLPLGGGREMGFFEIKSAVGQRPASIRLTRAEYERAMMCDASGIAYELYIVVFRPNNLSPLVYHIPDFARRASAFSLQDLVCFEVAPDYR